ncbi:MAG TPA: TcpE family conjugal transfer membrane protein [Streptosporangiaceae bacterium]
MDLPTYTNIWRIEKRLYKLYDFRLPMPLPVGQIAVFMVIAVPYILLLSLLGLPFSHTLVWVYVLPPGVLAWLTTRPVLEGKRLPELVTSQVRYLLEPRTWARMSPLAEKDEVVVICRVWRAAAPPASEPAAVTEAAETAEAAAPVPAAPVPAAGQARRAITRRPAARTARPAPRPLALPSRTARSAPPRAVARTEAAPGEPAARPRHGHPGSAQPGQAQPARSHPAPRLPSRGLPAQAQAGAGELTHDPAPAVQGRAVRGQAAPAPAGPGRGVPGQAARGLAGPGQPGHPHLGPGWPVQDPADPTRIDPDAAEALAALPDQAAPDRPVPGQPAPGRPAPDWRAPAAPDLAASDLAAPGQAAVGRAAIDRAAADRAASGWPAHDPASPGRPGHDRADQERSGAGWPVQDPSAPGRANPGKPPQWLQTLRPESAGPGSAVISGEVVAPSASQAQPGPVTEQPLTPLPVPAARSDAAAEAVRRAPEPPAGTPPEAQPGSPVAVPAQAVPAQAGPAQAGPAQPGPARPRHAQDPDRPAEPGIPGTLAAAAPPATAAPPAAATAAADSTAPADAAPSAEGRPVTDQPGEPGPDEAAGTSAGQDDAEGRPAEPAQRPGRPVVRVTGDRHAERPLRVVERALRSQPGQRHDGWRERVVIVPGGHRPGKPDPLQRDRARARLPISGPRRVVVLGCTRGAGQTMTTLLAGDMLATLRAEAVAVLDLNPGRGSLSERAAVIPGLIRGPAGLMPPGTGLADPGLAPDGPGLQVISGAAAAGGGDEAGRLLDLVAARYPITLADPAAGCVPRTMAVADQLLLVAPASAEAANALAMTFEWLEAHGYRRLADGAITVLNGVSGPTAAHVEHAASVASGRCRAIVKVPWDSQLKNLAAGRAPASPAGGPAQAGPVPDPSAALAAPAGAHGVSALSPALVHAYTALAGVLISSLAEPGELRSARG